MTDTQQQQQGLPVGWVAPERPVWPPLPWDVVLASEVAVPVLDRFVGVAREAAGLVSECAEVEPDDRHLHETEPDFRDLLNAAALASGLRFSRGWEWFAHVEVSDLTPHDPTRSCRESWCVHSLKFGEQYVTCTRTSGHTGRHAAGTGTQIVAVWGDRP